MEQYYISDYANDIIDEVIGPVSIVSLNVLEDGSIDFRFAVKDDEVILDVERMIGALEILKAKLVRDAISIEETVEDIVAAEVEPEYPTSFKMSDIPPEHIN
jgi:hypothetical protein